MLLSSVTFSAPPPSLPRFNAAPLALPPAAYPQDDSFHPTLSWDAPPARPAVPQRQPEKPATQSFGAMMAAALKSEPTEFDGWNIAR